MRIEVWDFDELRLLDMEKRRTSVIRSDEFIGYAQLPEMHDIVNDGFSLDDYFLLVDERGEYVVGYQADTFADQVVEFLSFPHELSFSSLLSQRCLSHTMTDLCLA